VTSLIVFLKFGRQNILILLYRDFRDESNVTLIALYEAWNKSEKAEEWWAKLPQTEAVIE